MTEEINLQRTWKPMEDAPRIGADGKRVYIRGINVEGIEAIITFYSFAKMGVTNTLGFWVTDLRFNEDGAPSYRIFWPVAWKSEDRQE